MKKVLFLISGLGLGNSTRCHGIISHLAAMNIEIHVASGGNGQKYFLGASEVSKVFPLRSISYGKEKNRLSVFVTALNLPGILWALARNLFYLWPIFRRGGYSLIIADSDYTSWAARLCSRSPLVSINNSTWVVEQCRASPEVMRAGRAQFFIEYIDYIYNKYVPSFILEPSFSGGERNFLRKVFPPLVRVGFRRRPVESPQCVALMASGSEFGFETPAESFFDAFPQLEFLILREGESRKNMRFLGRKPDNQPILNAADILIVNGGYSAIAEGIWLQKPLVVVPVADHAEQAANAHFVERMGLGLVATEDSIGEKLGQILDGFLQFVSAHRDHDVPMDGSESAARWLAGLIK